MPDETKNRISDINNGIVPEGYKKTKVGIVPVEWETDRLKNISKHSTEKNINLKFHETYTNSATQGIIKQTDYFDKQISNNENIDGYYVVRQNDYIYNPRISVSAPCGPIRKSHFAETGVMSPLYTVFRLNDEYEDNEYIEHYLYSPFWHRYMSSVANYGARHDRMNITNEDLFNMPIPFPPLPEQQKIAKILSTQDKLIELQEKKIEQLEKLKKGFLQKMFPSKGSKYPEIRFKGFTDAWEQRKLGDEAIEILAGGDIDKSKAVENGKYPIYANALTNNGVVGYYDDYYRVKAPAVTVTGRGEVGYAQARMTNFTPVVRLLAVRSNHDCYFMENAINNHKVIVESTGVPQLTVPQLSSYNIFFPTNIEEEVKIGEYFHNLDTLITLHQHKLEQEKQKKKALMQLLLTGKVRCV